MAGTQHTDALLGRSSVMSIAVSACERVGVRDRLSPAPNLSLISRDGESSLKKTRDCANSRHVRRRRRQEVVGTGGRQRSAGVVGVGAGALVQAFRGEAVPRSDAPVQALRRIPERRHSSMSGTGLRQRLEWHKQSRGSLINPVRAQRHNVRKVKTALEENYRVVSEIYHPVTYK